MVDIDLILFVLVRFGFANLSLSGFGLLFCLCEFRVLGLLWVGILLV